MAKSSILEKLSLYFIHPLFFMVPGILHTQTYSAKLTYQPLILLYVFLVINALLEALVDQTDKWWSPLFLLLELANILLLIYTLSQTSLELAIVLILYSLLVHLQYLFKLYHLEIIAVILSTLYKVFVLNAVAFYLLARFIPTSILYVLIPFFLPFFLSEFVRYGFNSPFLIKGLMGASIAVALVYYVISAGWIALLILLLIPLASLSSKNLNLQSVLIFTHVFSLLAILIAYFFT